MSTCKSISQVTQEIQHWLRLAIFLHGPIKENLLCVLHNKNKDISYNGLPEDPADLYQELSTTHLNTINKLVKNKILKKDQVEILLPKNGDNKTYSDQFDITLLVLLIINFTTLAPPKGGWNKPPKDNDTSIAANVLRCREWRNFLNHTDASAIDEHAFNIKWSEGVTILIGLGGKTDPIKVLKTISLDPKHDLVLKSLYHFNNVIRTKQQTQDKDIRALETRADNLDNTSNQFDQRIDKCETDNDLMCKQLQTISLEIEKLKELQQQNSTESNDEKGEGKVSTNSF